MQKQGYYLFLSLIILMSSASLFATDIYLPALPDIANHFNCSQTDIQGSITVFLIGLASCQLAAGMLSDRFGRKKVVITGFTIFTLTSFLCAYAHSLTEFYILRILQAMGAGAGSVVSRTLIANRYDRQTAAQIFSTTFPIIGLSAAIAPLIGGYLTTLWGWRSTFMVIAGLGLAVLCILFCSLEDNNNLTSERSKSRNEVNLMTVGFPGYLNVIRTLEFLGYALIISASFCVFRCYAVESPFVFNKQGYGAEQIGHFYFGIPFTYVFGNLLAKKLLNKLSLEKVLTYGIAIFVLGGLCMVVATLLLDFNPYAIILPMCLITIGNGFLFPVGSAGALSAVSSEYIGTASGVMGAIQFLGAAVCINWVGKLCQGEAVLMAMFVGTIILIGLSSYLFLMVYKTKTRVTTI